MSKCKNEMLLCTTTHECFISINESLGSMSSSVGGTKN